MLQLTIPEEDKQIIGEQRYSHPHPRVQQRMWALWMKAEQFAHQDIARALGVTSETVLSYMLFYRDGGLEGLRTLTFHKPASELKEHQATLEAYFREHPPSSIAQARAEVKRLTGIERSPTQIGVFLRSTGMKYRKVAAVPAKVDLDAQEIFKKRSWSPA
jgi:transposase